jgi:hypothetical protein
MEKSDLQALSAILISMIKFTIHNIDQGQEIIELLHNLEYMMETLQIILE